MELLVPTELEVKLDRVWQRLRYTDPLQVPTRIQQAFQKAVRLGEKFIEPLACYNIFSIETITPSSVKLKEVSLKSRELAIRCNSAKELVVFIVTLGSRLEEQVKKLFSEEPMVAFILYNYGLEAVSAIAHQVRQEIQGYASPKGYQVGERYCPGYGDWDTREQRKLFSLLNGDRIGVRLGPSFMMYPLTSYACILPLGPGVSKVKIDEICYKKIESYTITVLPQGKRLEAMVGDNLFYFLVSHGYPVQSACGGMGICGKCRVLVHRGTKLPTESEQVHLTQEELDNGWRLSCMQHIDRDIILEIPRIDELTQAKKMLEQELQTTLSPGIEKTYLELPKPGRDDQRADTTRVQEGLGLERLTFPLLVLQKTPQILREGNFKLTITREGEQVVDIEPGNTTQALYGLAIDIGTTTLAGYLLDLNTGQELAICSQMNPQRSFGADVISRIKYVHEYSKDGLKELQEAVVSGLNAVIRHLCQTASIEPYQIYKATVVGNPTMIHLFTAIDPSQIDHSPYIPVLRGGFTSSAKELGLGINSGGLVYILPSVSGYVGADITAGVLFTGLHEGDELSLLVDIGTNAEIVLGNNERILACSTAAGPAFEGARIKYGMNATPGAIAHVSLDGIRGNIELEVIQNGVPKGICGSGLIDLAAELLKVGLINERGKFLLHRDLLVSQRVTLGEKGHPQFLVTDGSPPIYVTQQDIRELQLAKGAIHAGVEIILHEWGATIDKVNKVYLAGAFGNYVRRESVLRIGMLPPFPLEKIKLVGNAAGQGAKLCLLNHGKWAEVQKLAERLHYFELSYCKEFSQAFIKSMYFPSQE